MAGQITGFFMGTGIMAAAGAPLRGRRRSLHIVERVIKPEIAFFCVIFMGNPPFFDNNTSLHQPCSRWGRAAYIAPVLPEKNTFLCRYYGVILHGGAAATGAKPPRLSDGLINGFQQGGIIHNKQCAVKNQNGELP
jgi:hypothetical protein